MNSGRRKAGSIWSAGGTLRLLRSLVFLAAALPLSAQAAPSAADLITKSIAALKTTCYEAQMRFISYDDTGAKGGQREVKIYHVAPDLYHVVPISGGNESSGSYYIENAQELVLIHNKLPVYMPERQFAGNDAMATKFLRDLGKSSSTAVLNGQVGQTEVYALRLDASRDIPYTITVGVDKKTYFPLYMMVNDSEGRTRVYYEMLSISYKRPDELNDNLFVVDDSDERQAMPRAQKSNVKNLSGNLPLFPSYLPEDYSLEAIRLIDCPVLSAQSSAAAGGGSGKDKLASTAPAPQVVFQLEIYGPRPGDVISIFQSRGSSSSLGLDHLKKGRKRDFIVGQQGNWMITVFGAVDERQLEKILESLEPRDEQISQLLQETSRLDEIMQEAFPEDH